MPPSHGMHDHTQHGHTNDAHEKGHDARMFKDTFWLSFLLTIPILLYSEMIQEWLHFTMPTFTGSNWLTPILGTIIFFYGGGVFIKSAWNELADRQPGMMTLISLAILSAYTYSIATAFWIEGTEFFWELATLIVIMLLGHWMEMRSVRTRKVP